MATVDIPVAASRTADGDGLGSCGSRWAVLDTTDGATAATAATDLEAAGGRGEIPVPLSAAFEVPGPDARAGAMGARGFIGPSGAVGREDKSLAFGAFAPFELTPEPLAPLTTAGTRGVVAAGATGAGFGEAASLGSIVFSGSVTFPA